MGRREENKERMRDDIQRTALALYRERGFDETRVQDIIEPIGISEKTFFNYFPSKQAVLEASAAESQGAYRELLLDEVGQTERPVADRLAEIVLLWAMSFSEDREFQRSVVLRTPVFFGSSGSTRDEQHEIQLLLAELLRQGQKRGEITEAQDPIQLAEVLTASMMLTTINWLDDWWGPSTQSLEERLARALDVFLSGAGTRTQRRRRVRRARD